MVTERTTAKKTDKLISYEMVVIISPQVVDDQLEAVINNIIGFITSRGGNVSETARWGKKSLAYPIKRSISGTYVLFRFTLMPGACKELEGSLKISEQVLRHLLIKLDSKTEVKPKPVAAAGAAG